MVIDPLGKNRENRMIEIHHWLGNSDSNLEWGRVSTRKTQHVNQLRIVLTVLMVSDARIHALPWQATGLMLMRSCHSNIRTFYLGGCDRPAFEVNFA
jgi:hypothetical protein